MTEQRETIEQIRGRLKREDRAKEEAFQKRLKGIDEASAAWRVERDEKEWAEEQKREELHRERQEAREKAHKDSMRSSWMAAGGCAEEFEEAWPQIRREALVRETLAGENRARRSAAVRTFQNF